MAVTFRKPIDTMSARLLLGRSAVATGTSGGLLDEQRAQSVFKHKILSTYVLPFAEMTGSKAERRRVVVFDGFAGRGRYPDGTPASAELVLQTSMRAPQAVIESIFVEKNRADFQVLSAVVDEYRKKGVTTDAHRGAAQDFLPGVVTQASGAPLFMFLDPCGAGIPWAQIVNVLAGARKAVWPPTEVLLNFSADLTRRAAGVLRAGLDDHDILPLMDGTCGSDWWREVALAHVPSSPAGNFEPAAFAVVNEYARRLGAATDMHAVTVPVRRRAHQQPIYHLVFLTRKSHGIWVFADAVARARQDWMLALGPAEDDDDGALFSFADSVGLHIESEQTAAQDRVASNLQSIVAAGRQLRLVDDPWSVFGDQFGVATESTVRKAVRALQKAGRLRLVESKKQLRDWVIAQ